MKIWNIYIDKNRIRKYLHRIISNFFINPVMYPVYALSHLMPRDKNLWVCGIPRKFVWNSKYVFLEANNQKRRDVQVVWITRSRKIARELQAKKYPAYFWLSWQGIWYPLRAGCHIIDASIETINFWLSGSAKIALIWHGIPLKKIAQDVDKGKSLDVSLHRAKGLQQLLLHYLLPWRFVKPDYIFTTSPTFQALSASSFRVRPDQVFVTGFPKNDIYFTDIPGADVGADASVLTKLRALKARQSSQKTILYAPTWRDTGGDSFFEKSEDLANLDEFLSRENLLFFLKLHPLAQAPYNNKLYTGQAKAAAVWKGKEYKNILFVSPDSDADPLLPFMDMLVTDYSGIYFEFLLLDRPIIFFPFDYEKYVTQDRELYFDYNAVTPGPKARTLHELMGALKTISDGKDEYREVRKKVLDMSYQYQDGKSAQRVCDLLLRLLHAEE